jgi:hypothetical protein
MRRGHDGEGIGPEPVFVEATGRDERRQLKGLGGRSQEDELIRVAARG